MESKRVVITGMGIVSPIGIGVEQFWTSLLNGRANFRIPETFDSLKYRSHLAGVVEHQLLRKYVTDKEFGRLDKCSLYALVATRQAISDAQIGKDQIRKAGLILATTSGGWESGETYYKAYLKNNKNYLKPSLLFNSPYFRPSYYITRDLSLEGRATTLTAACASGTMSVAYAFDLIRRGVTDIMLAGGTDVVSELPFALFNALRIVSPDLCRPFDKDRKGLILSEGSAILLLESVERAVKRNANIYAEVKGYGLSCDAYHMTRSHPEGLVRALNNALNDAAINLDDIDHVNCHGTGTRTSDLNEALALQNFFGRYISTIPVNTVKSTTGHMQGTAGSAEAIVTALTIKHGLIPPVVNVREVDPSCKLNFVLDSPLRREINTAVSNSLGFGGVNASIVMNRFCLKEPKTRKLRTKPKRVVITGLGVITPLGVGINSFQKLNNGEKRFGKIDSSLFLAPGTTDGKVDRVSSLVLQVSKLAISDSKLGILDKDKEKIGVSLETFYGSQCTTEFLISTIVNQGPRGIRPNDVPKNTFNAPATFTAQSLGLKGPNSTFANSCGSGFGAIGYAFDLLASGKAEVMLCGGYDELSNFLTTVYPYYGVSPSNLGKKLTEFDRSQKRLPLSEGVGILVLETLEHATERDARIYGEILGYDICNNDNSTIPLKSGIGNSILKVLKNSEIALDAIDCVSVFSCSKTDNENVSEAIRNVFGSKAPNILEMSVKPNIGHTLGASVSIDLIHCILSLTTNSNQVNRNKEFVRSPTEEKTILFNFTEKESNTTSVILRI
jgi:3-oxoacyl-[acyl-carrier-protein] synthase II